MATINQIIAKRQAVAKATREVRQDGFTKQQARVACEFQGYVVNLPRPDYESLDSTLKALRHGHISCTLEACWDKYYKR